MPPASEIEHLILEFQRALLQRHDLSSPDGRALYEYRLTAEEFHKLKYDRVVASWRAQSPSAVVKNYQLNGKA